MRTIKAVRVRGIGSRLKLAKTKLPKGLLPQGIIQLPGQLLAKGINRSVEQQGGVVSHSPADQSLLDQNTSKAHKIQASFCEDVRLMKKVYRLRYDLFTQEYGSRLRRFRKYDKDRFDPFCEHLVVRESGCEDVVGYTRILPFAAATKLGGFYSEGEFDLSSLAAWHHQSAEIGRTCIHTDYRNGVTIATLWSRLAEYLAENGIRYLFGCASISLKDGGVSASHILRALDEKKVFDKTLTVKPRKSVSILSSIPLERGKQGKICLPPLLKAYINMGARIAPEPYWDTEFNVADLFILLDLENLNPRYMKRFMKVACAA